MKRKGSISIVVTLLLALTWTKKSSAEADAEAARSMLHRGLRPRPTSSKTSKTSSCFVTPYRGLFVQEEPNAAGRSAGVLRGGLPGDSSSSSSGLRQHPDFGARVPWSFLRDLADGKLGGNGSGTAASSPCPGCFLVYAIRHGRAVSNAVQQFVGEEAWNSGVGQACAFVGDVPELRGGGRGGGESPGGGSKGGKASWPLFDAPLSDRGREQASSLGELLSGGGWARRLVGGDESGGDNAVVVASPLSRTLDTALLALGPAFLSNSSLDFHVSEWARETTGVNTCDARRGVSGSKGGGGSQLRSRHRRRRHHCSCSYDKGLRELYPSSPPSSSSSPSSSFDGFPVVGRGEASWSPKGGEEGVSAPPPPSPSSHPSPPPPLPGLFSKEDELWEPGTRESSESVRERTQVFLEVSAELASRGREEKGKKKRGGGENDHRRIFVVAHSGWIEQLLVGVGRRGFVPENAELVPLLVQRKEGDECRRGVAAAAAAGRGAGSGAGSLLEEE